MREIVIDSFAGGGGASLGITAALGRGPDIAINHSKEAIAIHAANHPETEHFTDDIWHVRPKAAVKGRPVGLGWFSPDCCNFSRARGGTPVKKEIRALAWTVIHWALQVRPRVVILENVREFCFPAETAVLTKRGVIPISTVEVGDEVWTHNARWKPVTAVSKRVDNTINVVGYGNSIIEPTANHPFYTRHPPGGGGACARGDRRFPVAFPRLFCRQQSGQSGPYRGRRHAGPGCRLPGPVQSRRQAVE